MVTKYRLVCALSVASIAMSACSTSVAGQPVSESDTPATEKVATQHADSHAPRYVDVSGQGVALPRDSDGFQFSATALPGVAVGHRKADDTVEGCTLGPAVSSKHDEQGFLTAGHCTANLAPTMQYLSTSADTGSSAPILLGTAEQAQDAPSPSGYSDSAVIWTGTVDPAATRIANTWPIAGVMPVSAVKQLPAGTPICIDGAKSGVVCSPLISVDADFIRIGHVTQSGDSGAAVFVVDQTGNATLIGIHSGTESGRSEATFLEPALQRLGATTLTAR